DLLPLGGRVARIAKAAGARTAAVVAPAGATAHDLEALAEGAALGLYQFAKYLTGERATPAALEALTLLVARGTDEAAARSAIARAALTSRAVARARDLVNEPAGTLTPTRLAALATEWARGVSVEAEVLDREACRKLGMGLYLAVAQGSVEEPRFI